MFDNLKRLASDDRGQSGAGTMAKRAIAIVVGLTVGGLVAAFLLPVALDQIVAVDTSNYSDGAAAMWDLMDVIITLAVVLFFVGIALAAVEGT
jgi:protein-S-isoprenylcysteine O-methyltransferase Ste14